MATELHTWARVGWPQSYIHGLRLGGHRATYMGKGWVATELHTWAKVGWPQLHTWARVGWPQSYIHGLRVGWPQSYIHGLGLDGHRATYMG